MYVSGRVSLVGFPSTRFLKICISLLPDLEVKLLPWLFAYGRSGGDGRDAVGMDFISFQTSTMETWSIS
jgi:hypothetical protein